MVLVSKTNREKKRSFSLFSGLGHQQIVNVRALGRRGGGAPHTLAALLFTRFFLFHKPYEINVCV